MKPDDAVAPRLNVDLYDPGNLARPWDMLRSIREAGPLVWNEQGFWMTGHDRVCRQVLNSPDQFGQEGLIASLFGEEAFISIDERAMHNALRNVWVAAFGSRGVERLVPFVRDAIVDLADGVVEELSGGGQVDIMARLCRPLPAVVIARMMGVAPDMVPVVIAWSDAMADATSGGFPIDYANDPAWLASEAAKRDLGDYIRDQIRYRRGNPGEDLVSMMVGSDIARTLSDEALMVNIRQLLFAGNETTAKWLGHIVVTLAEDADLRGELRQTADLIPDAVEEVLRWQGVTQVLPRGVMKDGAQVAGVALPQGAQIILLIGAAGRDPARWDAPDRFDLHRAKKPHLAFVFGLHSCLGATLARMEAREFTDALLRRVPDFRVARPVTFGNFSLRGPASIVIERA
ncbi:hypothetical protein B2G71_04635 [Novosphingobium sp. PC22D]|uniref:cytochrome P450 n=1 Tax=Novosphingobium sp. PC22D TaxID=1962403 RepID=UPI000BF2467C|nr:cytochrome P450 [Novosphingobium sp. PC22D]PEQ13619.1 hypothetical protein B2G71_04635 [Novosphingobium sp. PC22D]